MNRLKQFLLLTLSIIMIFTSSISVYAEEGNGGGDAGGGGGTQKVVGGPSARKTAYLLYIVDENGNLLTPVVETTIAGCDTPPADAIYKYEVSRFGGVAPSIIKNGADWGTPYDSNGNGRGAAIKTRMLDKNEAGHSFAMTTIEKYFGSEVAQGFAGNNQYLIIEGVYWARFQNGTNKGYWNVATAKGWAQAQNDYGCGEMGSSLINRYTNNIYPNCMKFEFEQFGLTPTPSGKQTNNTIIDTAGGLISIWGREVDACTTCDETLGDVVHTAPDESKGICSIVKNYRTQKADSSYTDDGCFIRNNTSRNILIEDEISYRVVGWKISDDVQEIDSINWNPPGNIEKTGSFAGVSVKIEQPSNTLYVLLEKAEIAVDTTLEADYKLGESQITRAVSLKTDDQGDDILNGYKFKWDFGSLESCGGHRHEGSHTDECATDCSTDHSYTTYCTFSLNNTDWTFKIKNGNRENYPSNLAINSNWTDYNSEASDTRSGLAAGNIEKEFDHKVVFHRGTDALSLAEWKNTNEALTSLNNFNAVNSKTPTRKKTDYVESVTFSFEDDSSDVTTSSTGTESCTVSDDAELSNPLTTDVGILYKTYSGSISGGKVNTDIDSREMLTIGTSGDRVMSGRMIESGLHFNFHPYIKMRYDTMDSSGSITKDNEILVLGEHKRGMCLNDYAEIIWTKSDKENLSLVSGQWSIHAQPVQDVGSNSLLPGGAQMMLGIKNDDRQTITARTYQCILVDDGRTQVEKTDGAVSGYTKETALNFHKAYVQSMIEGIENLSVEQWQNKDYKADPFKGIAVYNEADLSSLKNTDNNRASSEEKYYFKNERGTAQSGCLDVKEGKTTTEYYTFRTDTSGNVYMNDEKILTKDQGVESLTGTALQINNRTLVVTKLLDSVERNSGNDTGATWITDGKWYNESFDGITVGISTTNLLTGFINPYERTTVLDPKLNTRSSGMSSMFSSYMVGQFKMKDFSTAYGMKYMLGEFKGNAILMNDMDKLYYSKKFYLSNVTTQDLH